MKISNKKRSLQFFSLLCLHDCSLLSQTCRSGYYVGWGSKGGEQRNKQVEQMEKPNGGWEEQTEGGQTEKQTGGGLKRNENGGRRTEKRTELRRRRNEQGGTDSSQIDSVTLQLL